MTEIETEVGADADVRIRDLALKSHQRLFFERVPLPPELALPDRAPARLLVRGPGRGRRSVGFPRLMQACGEFMTREEIARVWFSEEYEPVVADAARGRPIGEGMTEAEAYSRVVSLRYLLLRTHRWDEEILERLREELRRKAPRDEDTLTHMMRGDLRG